LTVTDSFDENKAKKTDTQRSWFQVKTEPLSKKGLVIFFQRRISREAVAV
jgi:hypothetical protein